MQKKIYLTLAAAVSLAIPVFTAHGEDDTFYRRDARGNLSGIHSSDGSNTYYQRDANGNITCKRDDEGNLTYYSRDANGNLTRVTHVDGAKPVEGPVAESKPTPSFSRPQPVRSAPAPVSRAPQIAPRPQLPSITEITAKHSASSAAEIRSYLHDDGFNGLSTADIEKISAYLKEKGKSIAEIGSAAAVQLLK